MKRIVLIAVVAAFAAVAQWVHGHRLRGIRAAGTCLRDACSSAPRGRSDRCPRPAAVAPSSPPLLRPSAQMALACRRLPDALPAPAVTPHRRARGAARASVNSAVRVSTSVLTGTISWQR